MNRLSEDRLVLVKRINIKDIPERSPLIAIPKVALKEIQLTDGYAEMYRVAGHPEFLVIKLVARRI